MNAQSGAPVIVAKGLGHTYKGGHTALAGVDLELGAGLFGLLGPNGAGKSTLMRILCTLLVPTEGRASVFGHDVGGERQAVRERIGYLPQDFGGWRLHRVEEVLDTLARLSGMHGKAERRERVAEVLEAVGLSDAAHRKVKKLSGGMVRRLGVAQALVHEPPVLVVDEPTVGLDPEERMRFRQLMARLGRDRTILLSTHIVADLGGGCRELALLDAGEVVFKGTPGELVQQANGKVFETRASAVEAERIETQHEVVSRRVVQGGVELRFVAADAPAGATPVTSPTLEESYLAFMAARGRSEAARQDEDDADVTDGAEADEGADK